MGFPPRPHPKVSTLSPSGSSFFAKSFLNPLRVACRHEALLSLSVEGSLYSVGTKVCNMCQLLHNLVQGIIADCYV